MFANLQMFFFSNLPGIMSWCMRKRAATEPMGTKVYPPTKPDVMMAAQFSSPRAHSLCTRYTWHTSLSRNSFTHKCEDPTVLLFPAIIAHTCILLWCIPGTGRHYHIIPLLTPLGPERAVEAMITYSQQWAFSTVYEQRELSALRVGGKCFAPVPNDSLVL